jgi:signal peptidase I
VNRTAVLAVATSCLVAPAAVALGLRACLLSITVRGSSMEPACHSGQHVLALRAARGRPVTGDVVVVRDPFARESPVPRGRPDLYIVKRIAAVAGEPVPESVRTAVGAHEGAKVPPGQIVVLGDNSAASIDSRNCGYLPTRDVVGIVLRGREHGRAQPIPVGTEK